jgi:protein TonB
MTLQRFYNDRSIGFVSSFVVHLFLFFLSSFIFAKPIEYAMGRNTQEIEVSLTAAPAESFVKGQMISETPKSVQKEEPAISERNDMPVPEDEVEAQKLEQPQEEPQNEILFPENDVEEQKIQDPQAKIKEEHKEIETTTDSLNRGDGSSPSQGKDDTTFHSADGTVSESKPNYLTNPAPPYPREARQRGWQGVVLLKVTVDKFGRPSQIEKEQSSGYAVLDEAAIQSVKRWLFRPAEIGTIPIASSVRVPIRFQLKN